MFPLPVDLSHLPSCTKVIILSLCLFLISLFSLLRSTAINSTRVSNFTTLLSHIVPTFIHLPQSSASDNCLVSLAFGTCISEANPPDFDDQEPCYRTFSGFHIASTHRIKSRSAVSRIPQTSHQSISAAQPVQISSYSKHSGHPGLLFCVSHPPTQPMLLGHSANIRAFQNHLYLRCNQGPNPPTPSNSRHNLQEIPRHTPCPLHLFCLVTHRRRPLPCSHLPRSTFFSVTCCFPSFFSPNISISVKNNLPTPSAESIA